MRGHFIKCDRCGEIKETSIEGATPHGWTSLYSGRKDLCAECTTMHKLTEEEIDRIKEGFWNVIKKKA